MLQARTYMFSMQKQEGRHYTNKGTALPVKISSVPILYTFPPTPTSIYITAILLLVQELSKMNLNPCFVLFKSEYFPVYRCFSCVFLSVGKHSVHRHNNEYNYSFWRIKVMWRHVIKFSALTCYLDLVGLNVSLCCCIFLVKNKPIINCQAWVYIFYTIQICIYMFRPTMKLSLGCMHKIKR